jgi:hypothetical protein
MKRLAVLLLLLPLTGAGAQVRVVTEALTPFRINRLTVENPRRTPYRRLTILGRTDRGKLLPLFEDPAPGARERIKCRVYLDDSISELVVELESTAGRTESRSLRIPAAEFRLGVYGVSPMGVSPVGAPSALGAPGLLPAPYFRLEEAGRLEPGDLFVDPGILSRETLEGLLEAGIHCLSSSAGFAGTESGRYRGIFMPINSDAPAEIARTLAARRRELMRFKANYRNLITAEEFYGVPSRDSRLRFAGSRPGDIAATLTRDYFAPRLTRPQILALSVFYAACLLLLLLIRSPALLLGLAAALVLSFFLVLFQLPAREQLLVIELNPSGLEAPELAFETSAPGRYRSRPFSPGAPLLAYRQFASFRKRFPLAEVDGAVMLRSNQIPVVRNENGELFMEYAANPLKIWTLHATPIP